MEKLVKIKKHDESGYVVSSRVIAKELGKRHDNVLRDIENILISSNLRKSKSQSTEISVDLKKVIFSNIYKDSKNRNYKEYLLTKDGFILYMFNIQGHIDFKMAYINEFNRMEKELQDKQKHILPFEEDKEGVKHMKKIYKSKERMEIALNEYKYNLIIGKAMIENALLDIKNSGFKTNKMSVYFDGKGYNTVKSFLEFE